MTIDVIITPIAEHVETYQTLWAGILGFLGVMYTLYKNNENQLKLQAEQKQHDLELQANRTAHEANTIRLSLKSELAFNRDGYKASIYQFKKDNNGLSAFYSSTTKDVVHKALLEKLGLLSEVEIEKVFIAYRLIAELPYRLRFLVDNRDVGGLGNNYIVIPPLELESAAAIFELQLPAINAAINLLDERLKVSR